MEHSNFPVITMEPESREEKDRLDKNSFRNLKPDADYLENPDSVPQLICCPKSSELFVHLDKIKKYERRKNGSSCFLYKTHVYNK